MRACSCLSSKPYCFIFFNQAEAINKMAEEQGQASHPEHAGHAAHAGHGDSVKGHGPTTHKAPGQAPTNCHWSDWNKKMECRRPEPTAGSHRRRRLMLNDTRPLNSSLPADTANVSSPALPLPSQRSAGSQADLESSLATVDREATAQAALTTHLLALAVSSSTALADDKVANSFSWSLHCDPTFEFMCSRVGIHF